MDDMILPEELSSRLGKIAKDQGGMSLLLHGRPGMGKTTFAKLINPDSTLYINCTKDNSVTMVNSLQKTCSPVSLYGRRVVLLDEADYLTENAQAALRGIVEQLSINNDFVMTANKPERLSDAIKSRFLPVNFDFLKTDQYVQGLVTHLSKIATEEGYINTDKKHLEVIVRTSFPDIRLMIKKLQYELG